MGKNRSNRYLSVLCELRYRLLRTYPVESQRPSKSAGDRCSGIKHLFFEHGREVGR
jgi:hypothetical protein